MSEVQTGQEWGMCAAYGCPLFGSVGGDGRWFCFCHAGRPSASNDAVTQRLRSDECWPLVQSSLEIRRNLGSFHDAPDAYRAIQRRLAIADRKDILMGSADCSPHKPGKPIVRMWLARIERELIRLTGSSGKQQGLSGLVPTAPVIGPTHAMQHYTERGQ